MKQMKMNGLSLFGAVVSSVTGSIAAQSHPSVVDHAHPHQNAVDGLLLGQDAFTLAMIGLGVLAIMGGGLLLVRRRGK